MRRLLFVIIALATLLPSLAQAYDVLVLQSSHNTGYEQAFNGFRSDCKAPQRVVVLSDYVDVDVVRIVREERPRLILAIGDTALAATRKITQTPVIAVVALGINAKANLTGVTMFAPPEKYCNLFKQLKVHNVGVIHNPDKTGWYLDKAQKAAEKVGIKLIVRKVATPRETLAQLDSLAGKVDTLWMLPDTTAVTRETVEAYFRFGQHQAVPVVSFASSYLGLGAAAAVDINSTEMGRQAGDMANALLRGVRIDDIPRQAPRGTKYTINPNVLGKLDINDASE
ncbi:ABC transporter substrate-binding protein [Geobacter sp. AOG1]|uniref:ABC transporter substrate-binding protein n=1 Tax=Geobacter sp. AOG1 TaxID=1566346 RepID=UPI001CC7E9A5|nr:ABC transporter substrate binding protein [Geobacter sp. AOG1]GFE57990.1 ABC transporter substrate-binding protein [Geobacter sp. AOG1]